jgi:enterochelin esterase-like enzyme
MAAAMKTSRAQVWMESLGDWSWPGTQSAAELLSPPSWVPTMPPRLETAGAGAAATGSLEGDRGTLRAVVTAALLALLASVALGLAVKGPAGLEQMLGEGPAVAPARAQFAELVPDGPGPELPTLKKVNSDSAGSYILTAAYPSRALGGSQGSFYVYLPPGYASTNQHYPVIYLLHGYDQAATAFLESGLQATLDSLIARHAIDPVIAVMVEGSQGDRWRAGNERYVLEVQELVDRMLPTIANRDGRAIAGVSMGGYGAMNIALGNPLRFGVAESWMGFFNGLEGQLHADRPIFSKLGFQAFVYGAEADHITDPEANAPFAAALRSAGAKASSAIYPGGHSLETMEAHLESTLAFAARAMALAERPAVAPARPRPAKVTLASSGAHAAT